MSLNPSLFDSLGTQAQARYEGPLSPVSMPSVSTFPDSIGFGGPTYAEQVLLGGAFPVLRSPTMQEEMEGRFAAAEALFENAYGVLSQIQNEVPPDQQADVLAEYLRESGFSSHVVEQTLGIPRSEVDAALMAAGYDVYGNRLPEEDVFADTTASEVTLAVPDLGDFVGPVQPFVGPPEPEDDTDEPKADTDEQPKMVDLVEEVPGVVTDDPSKIWKKTKTDDLSLEEVINTAFDIFGAFNKEAINNVVDIVNDRGISVQEVANATGNSVESINQAATESGTAIENQGTGDTAGDGVGDTDGMGDVAGTPTPTTPTSTTPTTTTPTPTPTPEPTPEPDDEPPSGIFTGLPRDDTPPPETPIQILTETPQPTPQMGLLALIQSTPVTEQMFSRELFEPKLRELDNVAQALGMIQSIGRRF